MSLFSGCENSSDDANVSSSGSDNEKCRGKEFGNFQEITESAGAAPPTDFQPDSPLRKLKDCFNSISRLYHESNKRVSELIPSAAASAATDDDDDHLEAALQECGGSEDDNVIYNPEKQKGGGNCIRMDNDLSIIIPNQHDIDNAIQYIRTSGSGGSGGSRSGGGIKRKRGGAKSGDMNALELASSNSTLIQPASGEYFYGKKVTIENLAKLMHVAADSLLLYKTIMKTNEATAAAAAGKDGGNSLASVTATASAQIANIVGHENAIQEKTLEEFSQHVGNNDYNYVSDNEEENQRRVANLTNISKSMIKSKKKALIRYSWKKTKEILDEQFRIYAPSVEAKDFDLIIKLIGRICKFYLFGKYIFIGHLKAVLSASYKTRRGDTAETLKKHALPGRTDGPHALRMRRKTSVFHNKKAFDEAYEKIRLEFYYKCAIARPYKTQFSAVFLSGITGACGGVTSNSTPTSIKTMREYVNKYCQEAEDAFFNAIQKPKLFRKMAEKRNFNAELEQKRSRQISEKYVAESDTFVNSRVRQLWSNDYDGVVFEILSSGVRLRCRWLPPWDVANGEILKKRQKSYRTVEKMISINEFRRASDPVYYIEQRVADLALRLADLKRSGCFLYEPGKSVGNSVTEYINKAISQYKGIEQQPTEIN